MILKHRDTEVLRFDWVEPFGVKNVEVNAVAERFLPLAFREKVRVNPDELRFGLEEWLLHRTPPTSRRGIRDMLRHLGFRTDDPSWKRELVTFSRGLSLNDVHWVVADDSNEKWATANLYDNPFSTAVASMAFTGDKRIGVRDASTSPEYSTDGNLRKCWRRLDGEVLLFKAGGHDDGGFFVHRNAVGYEPLSEYYAAQVAEAMKLPHVPYDLARFKHRLCSTCPLFTSEGTGYLAARNVMDDMIDRLKGLGKFEFKPHPLFVMPDERLEVSQYFLQNRIAKIIRYREKADKYLNVRRKDDTINPTISDKILKKAQVADDLRKELKATLKSFPRAKTEKLAILFKTTTRTIARHIKVLQDAGELKRVGSRKTGYWQVIDNPNHKEETK